MGYKEKKKSQYPAGIKPTTSRVLLHRCATTAARPIQCLLLPAERLETLLKGGKFQVCGNKIVSKELCAEYGHF